MTRKILALLVTEKRIFRHGVYFLVIMYISALTIAAATLLPPLRPRATMYGTSAVIMSSFA